MKTKMKKIPLVLMLVLSVFAGSVTGCAAAAAWWQQFQSNPVAQVQAFEQTVQVALSSAQVAFSVILPLLPSAAQATAQADFNNAVISVNHALQALNDAVQAAVIAQTPSPDFTAVITNVEAAMKQVIDIVEQYVTQSASPAHPAIRMIPGIAEAKAAAQSLTRFSGKF